MPKWLFAALAVLSTGSSLDSWSMLLNLRIKSLSVSNQWKLYIEHYGSVVMFIMSYDAILSFEFVDKHKEWPFKWSLLSSTFLWCPPLCLKLYKVVLTESYWAYLSCGQCCLLWSSSSVLSLWIKFESMTIQMKAISDKQYLLVALFIMLCSAFLNLEWKGWNSEVQRFKRNQLSSTFFTR